MDAVRLKSSCICGNTRPYLECCGRYAQAPIPSEVTGEVERKWADFRHVLHELYMYLFPLRNLYQAYWEKLSEEEYPHHLLMADAEYGRAVVANFFWDYSVQFSDARPILRAARDIEGKDIRMANDFRQWSLAPMWLVYVVEADERHAHLRPLGSEKVHRVLHGGELPEPGAYVAARLLIYRGEEYVLPAVLRFSEAFSQTRAEEALRQVRNALGLKSGAGGLRPDVQCDEWRRHGSLFLNLWREHVYDAVVGIPGRTVHMAPGFNLPVADTAEASRQLATGGAIALGRHKYEVRYRTLPVARLEIREDMIHGTLMDDAFRPYALHWIADHLRAIHAVDGGAVEDSTGVTFDSDPESWLNTPQAQLNGETPVQASRHDFGRRRLLNLLNEESGQGRDVTGLREKLGL